MRRVDYVDLAAFSRQTTRARAQLAGSRRHRTHRPRTSDEWLALERGVSAALKWREKSGRMVWTGPRTIRLR